jgi:hypothetical protein
VYLLMAKSIHKNEKANWLGRTSAPARDWAFRLSPSRQATLDDPFPIESFRKPDFANLKKLVVVDVGPQHRWGHECYACVLTAIKTPGQRPACSA